MRIDERVWSELDGSVVNDGPPMLLGERCGPYGWMRNAFQTWSQEEFPALKGSKLFETLEFSRGLRANLVFDCQVMPAFTALAKSNGEESKVKRFYELKVKHLEDGLRQDELVEFADYYRQAVEHIGFCPGVLDALSNCLDALYISAALSTQSGGVK